MGIPASAQRLINEDEPMEDDQTMESCRIQNQSIITLINVHDRPTDNSYIRLHIKFMDGKSISVTVPSNMTADSLKLLIEV